MATTIPFLFPIIGNLLGVYLILQRKLRTIRTMLAVNLAASVLFGLSIAVKVFCCSAEPSLWPMPLIFATLEYWAKFGIAIAIVTLALVTWSNRGGLVNGHSNYRPNPSFKRDALKRAPYVKR